MKYCISFYLILLMVVSVGACAREVPCEILQVRLNRIYLAAGLEAGIAAGSPFYISCDGNRAITGSIDYAGPGISYSMPMAELDTLTLNPACSVSVITADIDTAAVITIGTDMPLEYFNLEHEPLFIRTGDTIISNLADSVIIDGPMMTVFLAPDIRFSDGSLMTADVVVKALYRLRKESQSYLVRYFFARVLPEESGGIRTIDESTLSLAFYHPFPRAAYYLSHPDFAIANINARGTGPVMEARESLVEKLIYTPNPFYRGTPVAYARIIITHYEQQYRQRFAFDNLHIDAFIGFGFEADLAGMYQAKALYPDVVALIPSIGSQLFAEARFSTSVYYRFNPSLSHIYFQYGEIIPVNRWQVYPTDSLNQARFYPFNFLSGRNLFSSINRTIETIEVGYDQSLLYETARYSADIIAREGITASVKRYAYGSSFDLRLGFLPASDNIIPSALIAAVLDFSDQNAALPAENRLKLPGWEDLGQGSQMNDVENRRRFFARAEETLVSDGGFFPLFRPVVYAVAHPGIEHIAFGQYGYPQLGKVTKSRMTSIIVEEGGGQ